MNKNPSTIWIVLPCYNEEEVLPESARQLKELMGQLIESGKIATDSKIAFVNDGSKDATWPIIQKLHAEDNLFTGINLAHNRGHQHALLAGLMVAKEYADAVISMDADLQDDIHVIDGFVEKYAEGYDVVYGVRSSRKKDTFFKRFTAQSFYKLMAALGVETVYNHADCRLMSRRALEGLAEYGEVNLFLRGIVPTIGYPSTTVSYERNERFAGESKYPLKKMLSFAFDGITSFSIKPIRMVLNVGIIIFSISILMLLYALVMKLIGNTVPGWTSTVASIWFIGGVQLLGLGIVGEYIGKIYSEVKHRPRYIIEQVLCSSEKNEKE